MADEIPVVCCLSDEQMRNREATLLAQFKSALVTTEEVSAVTCSESPVTRNGLL